jgi:hypothetical protein
MKTSSKPHHSRLIRLWLSLLFLLVMACTCALPQVVWPTSTTGEGPAAATPQSGDAQNDVQITFTADRTSLTSGECALLEWNTQGVEVVQINGEGVNRSGRTQVCPKQTTTYTLAVYAGGGPPLAEREIVISVGGSQSSPTNAPASAPTKAPTQAASVDCSKPPVIAYFTASPDNISAGQSSTLSWDATSNTPAGALQTVTINQGVGSVGGIDTRVVNPSQTTTYTLTATGCGGTSTKIVTVTVASQAAPPGGGSWGVLTADLAVTDLFPDNYPQGTVYVRITNNGPGSPSNVTIQLSCTCGKNPYNGSPPSANGYNAPLTISLVPGQTEAYNTGITIDGSINWYEVTCSIQVPFKDPQSSNDSYTESIPPPP